MPEDLGRVRAGAEELVADCKRLVRAVIAPGPPVKQRIGEAPIAAVVGYEHLLVRRADELIEGRIGMVQPQEGSRIEGLIRTVDRDGVVCRGTAEVPTPAALRMVGESTGIDQERLAANGERECQCIRMAVRRDGEISERAGIGDDPDFPGSLEIASQDVVAAARKRAANRQPRA